MWCNNQPPIYLNKYMVKLGMVYYIYIVIYCLFTNIHMLCNISQPHPVPGFRSFKARSEGCEAAPSTPRRERAAWWSETACNPLTQICPTWVANSMVEWIVSSNNVAKYACTLQVTELSPRLDRQLVTESVNPFRIVKWTDQFQRN
jgi:hypothetical protein